MNAKTTFFKSPASVLKKSRSSPTRTTFFQISSTSANATTSANNISTPNTTIVVTSSTSISATPSTSIASTQSASNVF